MKQCQVCNAKFASEDAFQIHLGVGAPAFHTCNDATEMQQKGMTRNASGEWTIDESLIEHHNGWAYLNQQTKPRTLSGEQVPTYEGQEGVDWFHEDDVRADNPAIQLDEE